MGNIAEAIITKDFEFMKDDELRYYILKNIKKEQIKDLQELEIDVNNLDREQLLEVVINEL